MKTFKVPLKWWLVLLPVPKANKLDYFFCILSMDKVQDFDKLYLLMPLETVKKLSTCAKVGMQQACGFSQEPIYSSSSGKMCYRNETTPAAPVGFLVRLRQLSDFGNTDVIAVSTASVLIPSTAHVLRDGL